MRRFYTDGSFKANGKDAGGWAFLETFNGNILQEKFAPDFSLDNSSNKMELIATIEALKVIYPGESAQILCDSQYVVKGGSEYISDWIKNDWMTQKNTPILYKELWMEYLELIKDKTITLIWVRSHSHDEFNHRVDELARKCYVKPEEIKETMKEKKQINMKPSIGSVIYFDDSSKKYAVILNDVRVGNTLGFLARLLANSYGHELDFFSYNSDKFTVIQKKTEKEQRLTLQTIEQFKNNVEHEFFQLKDTCKHHIINNGDDAICKICEDSFGWWCPESKDHCCHYFSENGIIRLNDGTYVKVPKDHDEQYETYDDCIFCHAPEERK